MLKTNIDVLGRDIQITYKYIDGAHFFTSEDEVAAGLCAASNDLLTAFNEVSIQLGLLYEHNHGIKTKFKPPVPFEVFRQYVEAAIQGAEEHGAAGRIVPAAIQPWMLNGGKIA